MRAGQRGGQLDCSAIGRHGFFRQPLTVERHRQIMMGGSDVFPEHDRQLEAGGPSARRPLRNNAKPSA